MISIQCILKPQFCRQCTLQKHELFGNYNKMHPQIWVVIPVLVITVWVDKKAGNVGAQSGSSSISAVQRMQTQGSSWLVWSCGWCLEIWGCLMVSSGILGRAKALPSPCTKVSELWWRTECLHFQHETCCRNSPDTGSERAQPSQPPGPSTSRGVPVVFVSPWWPLC